MHWIALVSALLFIPLQDEIKTLDIGSEAPLRDHKMKNIDGKELGLEDIQGSNGTLVIFSCNTCPFVVGGKSFDGWEQSYASVHKAAEEHGFKLAMINSNEAKRGDVDSMKEMKKRAKKQGYDWPYLVDTDSKMADAFGARTTPHVFLFNKDWKLIYEGAIDNAVDSKREKEEHYLIDAMNAHASGADPDPAHTRAIGCSIKRNK